MGHQRVIENLEEGHVDKDLLAPIRQVGVMKQVLLMSLLLVAAMGCDEGPVQVLSAGSPLTFAVLNNERDQNAERFDAKYKGKYVAITGPVAKVEGARVYVGTDDLLGLFSGFVLNNVPKDDLVRLDKGETIVAHCRMAQYDSLLGETMRMELCSIR